MKRRRKPATRLPGQHASAHRHSNLAAGHHPAAPLARSRACWASAADFFFFMPSPACSAPPEEMPAERFLGALFCREGVMSIATRRGRKNALHETRVSIRWPPRHVAGIAFRRHASGHRCALRWPAQWSVVMRIVLQECRKAISLSVEPVELRRPCPSSLHEIPRLMTSISD